MITTLDTQSWSKELLTGNGEFVRDPAGFIYVVSNIRSDGTFAVFKSNPVPPDPGPGSTFSIVGTPYTLNTGTVDFDPAVTYDTTGGTPLIHIIGTQANLTDPRQVDLVKFTFNTGSNTLTFNTTLVTGSDIQDAYDIVPLTGNHTLIAATVINPQLPLLFTATITNVGIAGNTLTVVCNNTFTSGQLVMLSGLTTATFLNGALVNVITASPTQFTANYVFTGSIGPASNTGTVIPLYTGESLLVMELDASSNPVSNTLQVIANSPNRAGNTFSSVSLVTPDNVNVELYYEAHPKIITFTDQIFTVWLTHRNSGAVWDSSATQLTQFQGRFTDTRLTAILDASGNRYFSQTYFNQINHPEGLIGNIFLGYLPSDGTWSTNGLFATSFGSVAGGSFVQGTLSISETQGVTLSYLLQPFNTITVPPAANYPSSYPFHIATVDLDTLAATDVPGFYNTLTFTWLRGTKTTVDDASLWAVIGEKVQGIGISPLPVFLSQFNVPPIAVITPTTATVYRGQSLVLSATSSSDADQDTLEFIWSENDPDLIDVTLVPDDATATLSVSPAVGGAQRLFNVGVAVIDLESDGITPRHPQQSISSVQITSDVMTVTLTEAVPYAIGSTVGMWGVNLNPPPAPAFSVTPSGFDATPITEVDVDGSGTLSVLAANNLVAGQEVTFSGLTNASFLNGQTYLVAFADSAHFTAINTSLSVYSAAEVSGRADYPPAATYFFQVTYVNDVGETLPSPESSVNIAVGSFPVVISPLGSGTAAQYNVYASLSTGTEVLQTQTPINISTNWTTPDIGLVGGALVPTVSTAYEAFLNNPPSPYMVASVSGSTFTVNPFIAPDYGPASVTGSTIIGSQFATANITVPFNVAPTITFPSPQWLNNPPDNPSVGVERNSTIIISPDSLLYPVIITGVTDPDDTPTYTWIQTGGTTVNLITKTASPSLAFNTNGVSILGEALIFELTVDDGVNPPVSVSITVNVASYSFTGQDSLQLSRSMWGGTISQRNSAQSWSSLDLSALYTDLGSVKRVSTLDGSSRYVVISPFSVLVLGLVNSDTLMLRKLFTPNHTLVLDAVHTEQDYTLVLDDASIYRYSSAPLINTDNPDTILNLSQISGMTFDRIFTTHSFLNTRVIALSGPDGCLLMQVKTDTLVLQNVLELTVEADLLAGVDNVQFVRMAGVENLRIGKVFLGTVLNKSADASSVQISTNALTFTGANTFNVGDDVEFSGFAGVTAFLNGLRTTVLTQTPAFFIGSLERPNLSVTAVTEGTATALGDGTTYETLIDLAHSQIIGTWDASKLRNQYVNTGEVLFEPDSTYSGAPIAPVLGPVTSVSTGGSPLVTLRWVQERPDLVFGYSVEYTNVITINTIVDPVTLSFIVPNSTTVGQDLGVFDFASGQLTAVGANVTPGPGQYSFNVGVYTFNVAQATDTVAIKFVTGFQQLQGINSGITQQLTLPLASGTYQFRIKALSLDGISPYSNIQQATF